MGAAGDAACAPSAHRLGSDKPSLAIDDLHVFTRATVHDRACRAREWNDSRALRTLNSATVTWRTVVLSA